MTMQSYIHMRNVSKSSFSHIRNIRKIHKFLNHEATQQIIHAFISLSHSSMIYSTYMTTNSAGAYSTHSKYCSTCCYFIKKSSHITPVPEELHCLPVFYQIMNKILLIMYKFLRSVSPFYICLTCYKITLHYDTSTLMTSISFNNRNFQFTF